MAGWLLNGAEDGVNWIEVAPPDRIERCGTGDHGDSKTGGRPAWLGVALPWRDAAANSVHDLVWIQGDGETANVLRTVGHMAIYHKPTMVARPCAPQWMAPV